MVFIPLPVWPGVSSHFWNTVIISKQSPYIPIPSSLHISSLKSFLTIHPNIVIKFHCHCHFSFCESSQASHCLQNKVPIPFGWHSTIRSQYGTLVIHTYTTHYSNSITITVPEYSMDNDYLIEKEMATHSSILAWQMQWTEEPGGLQSMGLKKS